MYMATRTQQPPTALQADRQGAVLSHMPAIDGLRGIAILLVLIHHFTPAVSGSAFTKSMLHIAHTGWIGVDLFFVLSGFLITCILLKTRNNPDYFINFYARRTLRIFPIYYLTLVVLLVGLPTLLHMPVVGLMLDQWFHQTTRDLQSMLDGQAWLWLYGANVKIALEGERWGAVNHFWSLAVEEHFYLVWPVVVYFVSRQQLKRVCLILILSTPILRAMMMGAGFDSVVPYVFTLTRVDSLAVGGLLAALVTERNGFAKWTPRLGGMALMAGVMFIAIIAYYGRLHRDDFFTSVFGYSLLAVLSAWVVLKAAQIRPYTLTCRLLANPVFVSLGKYSYGIYVTHMFFVPVYIKLFGWGTLRDITGAYWMAIVLHCVLAIGCSWGIAFVCYHVFEKHFLRLKRFFDYRKPTTAPVPSTAPATRPVLIRPIRQAA
jgi:peptidoglycan/LPS O-acetylase OafA/YrhL